MSDHYTLESACQTLRGHIADIEALPADKSCGYYMGHTDRVYMLHGMKRALAVIEGICYEAIQCDIETSTP